MRLRFAGLALVLIGTLAVQAKPYDQERIAWARPMKPFHLIGNIHYVGTAGISAFLIVTPEGNILTDGGLEETASQIEANIVALGFRMQDIKIILNSHAHFDHSGGLAALKARSGARLIASAIDKPILESGHVDFGPSSEVDAPPVKVDQAVNDGDTVRLGGVTLTANITGGHTPGCTSWTMPLVEAGIRHEVIFFCSLTVAGNPLVNNKSRPQIVSDYRSSFARLAAMKPDIFLAPHGDQFRLNAKLEKLAAGGPNPFIDAAEFAPFLARQQAAFERELARQQQAATP
jgi:metallo-beta-lactamase class B